MITHIEGGITAPAGFRAAGVHCGIKANPEKLDLALLVSDLPAPGHREPRRRDHSHERAYVATMLLLVAVWALTGAGYFWPIWPMLGWGIGVVADRGGRLRGPCRPRSSKPDYSTGR